MLPEIGDCAEAGAGLVAPVAFSKTSLTQSDLLFLAWSAAASISFSSATVNRQIKRASFDFPLGRGGLPLLGFLGMLKQFFHVRQKRC